MIDNLYSIISIVFSIDKSKINSDSNPETIDSWDSLNTYILIDEIEKEFNVKFTLDEILSIKNVNSLESLLNNKISKSK
jgi:acyl carrier protein